MPQEFRVGNYLYRTRIKLDARQQFHIARRIAPVIGEIVHLVPLLDAITSAEAIDPQLLEALIMPVAAAISKMPDNECDYILDHCLAVVQRQSGNGAAPVWSDIWNARANAMQFADIELPAMLQIAGEVMRENLMGFFATGGLGVIGPTTAPMQPQQPESSGLAFQMEKAS